LLTNYLKQSIFVMPALVAGIRSGWHSAILIEIAGHQGVHARLPTGYARR
jgi:hypothetical protein